MSINVNSSNRRKDDFDKDDDSNWDDEESGWDRDNKKLNKEISKQGESSSANRSEKAQIQSTDKPVDIDADVLETTPSDHSVSIKTTVTEAKQPELPEGDPARQDVQETVKEAQKEQKTPKTEDLFKLLPKETRDLLDSLFSHELGSKANPRKFFDMLAKMIPLSLTLVQSKGKGTGAVANDISKTLASMVNEMESILQKHGDSTSLSQDNRNLIESLAKQLKILSQSEQYQTLARGIETLLASSEKWIDMSSQKELMKQLAETKLIPPSMIQSGSISREMLQNVLAVIQQGNMRTTTSSNQGMVQTLMQMNHLFSTVQAFPPEQREQVVEMMMRTQTLFSTNVSQGLLGPNTQQMTKDISSMLINISQSIGAIPTSKVIDVAGTQYLSRVLGELILAGAILGRLIIDKGDGKAMELHDALNVGQAQMRATRELGIIELIPFSFLAFYAPFEQMGAGKSKAEKEAIDALMTFIRTLMSLLFMLVAIYTGGKKIGENGTDLMLEANHDYINQKIDSLIFCMKKLKELYGVNVMISIQQCARAKISLNSQRFDEFWDDIFSFLTQKNDLFAFLDEVDQLDPLYESIHSLLEESGLDQISILRM